MLDFSCRTLRSGLAAAVIALGFGAADQAAAQACPNVGLSGQQLAYSTNMLTGAGQSVGVTAGGHIDLGNCGSVPGHGWIVEAPDFELQLNGAMPGQSLTLSATAGCDTVLLVNDAYGQWHFDDDSGGSLNPSITLPNPGNGIYDIWVGTYGSNTCPATLNVRAAGVAPPQSQFYSVPRVNGEIVDWCVTWATNCGQPGADYFCQTQGYTRASGWERFPGQRTLVLGSNQICGSGCDGLRNVTCVR